MDVTELPRAENAGNASHQQPRGYQSDSQSIISNDQNLEGELHELHVANYGISESRSSISHVPLSSDAFRSELENMVGSMSTYSFSEKPDDTDIESISGISSVYDDACSRNTGDSFINKGMAYYPNESGDWQRKVDWINGNLPESNHNHDQPGRNNYMLNGRHHSMYVSNSRSSYCGDYAVNSFSGNGAASSIVNHSGSFNDPEQPSSLPPLSVATIHRRLANPRVPVFDGQNAEKPDPTDGIPSAPHVGVHRNNSLPRPHSYAAPQTNFMKYRLSLARKRDLV